MSELQVICQVPNGIGYMPQSEYEGLPEPVKARVEILAVAPSKRKAAWICDHLPGEWRDVGLMWWRDDLAARVIEGVHDALP